MSNSAAPNLLQRLVSNLWDMVEQLQELIGGDPKVKQEVLADLGLDPNTDADLEIPEDALDSIDAYIKSVDPDFEAFSSVVEDFVTVMEAVAGFLEAAKLDGQVVLEEVIQQLTNLLATGFLKHRVEWLFWLARLLGFINEKFNIHVILTLIFKNIADLFQGPIKYFKNLYGESLDLVEERHAKDLSEKTLLLLGAALTFIHSKFLHPITLPNLKISHGGGILFEGETEFSINVLYGWDPVSASLTPMADQISDRTLTVVFKFTSQEIESEKTIEIRITLTFILVPSDHGGPGLFLSLGGGMDIEANLFDEWKLLAEFDSDQALDFLIHFDPDNSSDVISSVGGPSNAGVSFSLNREPKPTEPPVKLGGKTHFEFSRLSFSGEISTQQIAVKAVSNESVLVIASEDADGFIANFFPAEELRLNFNLGLGLGVARDRGFFFSLEGGAGLHTTIPLAKSIGPLHLQYLLLSLSAGTSPNASDIVFETLVTFTLKLFSLTISVDRIGYGLNLDFPESGGTLGLFDINLDFIPPKGIGLAIDGGGFKGGGFLGFDAENQRYHGILELEYQDCIDLKAIGLLTTELPGGKQGFSLLIIITAKFSAVQLGFGFTLNGVGGLLGLNRTAKIERLRTGVKDNTLSSILFPTDIVANAGRIISDLRQVFPPQEGRFIFGPMAKIGWGSPTLITIDLGLMIEVPNPVRLHILGVVRVQIPNEEERKKQEEEEKRKIMPILQLQVNFLGVIDFEKKQLAFDASLFDSKLFSFSLSGDMAIRLNWGNEPNFLLTVGGFHPAYEPPPMNLPSLRRLTLPLLPGNNPRLTLETYFAVTSNTVQFGAKLELYAAKGRFNVQGFLSFDVLFQFNPFYFIADISAMLALRSGSSSIASIKVDLTLEGTTPWKARGTAKLKLFWFLTVKIRFNKTFGEERDTILPAVEVIPLLEAALSASGNWQPQIPGRSHLLVSLKQIEAADDTIIAHPFGIMEISQKVVPLNIPIDKFGNQTPGDGNEFRIKDVMVGTEAQDTVDTEEFFAPAQFFEKTDSEKLSGKSFDKYDSGIRIVSSEKLNSDYYSKRDVEYELFYIDSQRDRRLLSWFDLVAADADAFDAWAVNGAIADSDLSFAKNTKSTLAPDEVAVGQENFAVVNTGNLTLFDDDGIAKNEEAALDKMEKLIQDNPALEETIQVVPLFEVNIL